MVPSDIILDLDTEENRENELFVVGNSDFEFRPRLDGASDFILDIISPFDYERTHDFVISIGCRRTSEPEFTETDNFDTRQLLQIMIEVEDVNDNPPIFKYGAFFERGILLSETPKNGRALVELEVTDTDTLPENKDVTFSIGDEEIVRLTESNNLRKFRSQGSYTFAVDEITGDITLEQSLKSDVHYYELVVIAKNEADGPRSKINVRFYPITEENTVRVQTENYVEFDEEDFARQLAVLYGKEASVVINDVLPIVSDTGQGNEVRSKFIITLIFLCSLMSRLSNFNK